MKFYQVLHEGSCRYGILEGDEIFLIHGSPFTSWKRAVEPIPLSEASLLPPCLPSKVVCVGLNYRDHAEEFGKPIPEEPCLFIKPASAVIGPGEEILLPPGAGRVDYEAELGVVVGRRAKNVSREEAFDYILGYCCLNDVTARELQRKDGQWTRAKSFDTFCPIGPCISTGLDTEDLTVELRLNREIQQSSKTSELIFPVPDLLSFISSVMTLMPGDVLATGTPSGVGPVKAGDVVEVAIEEIGILRNPVISAD